MRVLFKNHLENAIEALRTNRLRTSLTIIGVVIGIASTTLVLSLAGGVSRMLSNQQQRVQNSTSLIRSGDTPQADSLLSNNSMLTTNTLTEQDAIDLNALPHSLAAPIATIHTRLSTNSDSVDGRRATVLGTSGEIKSIANLSIKDGEFIDEAHGVVVGYQLSIDLFGTDTALGNVLTIRGQKLAVVGVLKPTNNPINYLGIDFDRAAIMPIDIAKQFTGNVAQIQQIVLTTDATVDHNETASRAEKILLKNHAGDHDFHILQGAAITAPNSQLVNGISLTIAIIAGISLIVGGIGIMNIMLVNVAERQREIGIRKAVGASNQHIINQFLIESGIIGLIGGLVGYLIGLGTAFGIGLYLPFTPSLQWQVAVLVISLSVLIGIIFGIYPAAHAARKDPIESLRQ